MARRFSAVGGPMCQTFAQLSDRADGFAARLPATLAEQYEVGILVAERDFVVRRESTHLPGAAMYEVVPGLHSSMLFSAETARRVVDFLTLASN